MIAGEDSGHPAQAIRIDAHAHLDRYRHDLLGMAVRIRKVAEKLAGLRNTTSEDIIGAVRDNLARPRRDDPWFSGRWARCFRDGPGV